MDKIDGTMAARIGESLRRLADAVEQEPVVFIDAGGGHRFNDLAEKVVLEKGMRAQEFIERLSVCSSHLRHLNCCGLGIHMLRISEEEVVVFLRRQQAAPGVERFNLTKKQKEVMGHLVRGRTNKKIAEIMKISPGTVNSHLDKIYFKLGCSNRLAACLAALEHGLFTAAGEDVLKKR